MAKEAKTNAMRYLEQKKIPYIATEYDVKDGLIDGVSVAQKVGKPVETVFKTLVTKGASGEYLVFDIPVAQELDLKKAARAAGEKNVSMIEMKDINQVTGYIRGGCSPIGMKKQYRTFLEASAQQFSAITISAGRVGMQLTLAPADLEQACGGSFCDLVKK